jgi:hypothetical protein
LNNAVAPHPERFASELPRIAASPLQGFGLTRCYPKSFPNCLSRFISTLPEKQPSVGVIFSLGTLRIYRSKSRFKR